MSYYNNDTNNINKLRFDESLIKVLENIGLRPVGIYQPSNTAGLKWSVAYSDPEFRWSSTNLEIKQGRYSFANYATMFGRTHIKDSETGEYLNLNALDVDCQIVYNRLSIPIEQILSDSTWDWVSDELQALVKLILSSEGVVNGDYSITLLDIFKRSTFVTKTRKVYGHHIYWLSRQQRKAIGTADCRSGYEFEIKTDNSLGLCTLPGSAHKDDPSFRYTAVGVTDHLLANDILYDLFLEMFRDCTINGKEDSNDNLGKKEGKKQRKRKQGQNQDHNQGEEESKEDSSTADRDNNNNKDIKLYDLSAGAIKATTGYMSDFIIVGSRHWFHVYFSGMMFQHRVSLKSGFEIVTLLCDMTNDEEKKARLEVIRLTYQKGFEDELLKGGPSLAKLIATTAPEYRGKEGGEQAAKVALEILRKIWSKDIKILHGKDDENDKKLSQKVIELLRPSISLLFRDGSDTAFAAIYVDDHRHTLTIHKSKRFNMWVRKMYYDLAGNTLGGEILNEVSETLQAEALFEGPIKNLEPRINRDPDDPFVYWYDLGDEDRNAIKITPYGWSIVESKDVPIVFRRYAGQLAQIRPSKEYPKDIFKQFMKLLNIKKDPQIRLVYECYVIALLVPGIAKAIFIVQGPQGAAKTTCQDLTKMLVDPNKATSLTPPRMEEQLVQQLQHNPLVYYDNLSYMPDWLSNAFCRAATGTANAKRELYSDDEDVIYQYKRAIGFNGISLAANRPDLLDRSFIVEIEAITDKMRRMLEGDILPEFERIKPQLFGFILDTLVKMLYLKSKGGIKLKSMSRMADFEIHCEMISRCLGHKPMEFVKAYRSNKHIGTKDILENSTTANVLIEWMNFRGINAWVGYVSELLAELTTVAIVRLKIDVQKDKGFPRSGNILSKRLKELKNSLLEVGIQVFWVDNPTENRRTLNIVKVSPTSPTSPALSCL